MRLDLFHQKVSGVDVHTRIAVGQTVLSWLAHGLISAGSSFWDCDWHDDQGSASILPLKLPLFYCFAA
jgi:hypothetical protein